MAGHAIDGFEGGFSGVALLLSLDKTIGSAVESNDVAS
jgi:hypothetical protein